VPSADTVSRSAPALMPVSRNRAWPALSVVTEVALTVLPADDAIVTGRPTTTVPDESRNPTVNSVGEFDTRLVGPLSVSVVPVTAMVTDCDSEPLVAVTTPDALKLAVPKAFVMLTAGHAPDAATARDILMFCRDKLAPYKRIRRLEFLDLPKTISGKIRRVEMRQKEQARALPIVKAEGEYFDDEFRDA